MKKLALLLLYAIAAMCCPAFAQEAPTKEGVKTVGEGLVNGAALLGVAGAMIDTTYDQAYDGRKAGAKTWTEIGDMHRASRPAVADFDK